MVMDDESPRVRQEAVKALGRSRSQKAVEPLIRSLNDRNACVREAACSALGEIGKPAIPPLEALLASDNAQLCSSVKRL